MTALYEQINAAWRTGGPSSLHRAAEQLAAQGQDESAIYDALEKLLLEVRAEGADDETEDRITDVMERLTGWCHESNHIHTARDVRPTEEGSADERQSPAAAEERANTANRPGGEQRHADEARRAAESVTAVQRAILQGVTPRVPEASD